MRVYKIGQLFAAALLLLLTSHVFALDINDPEQVLEAYVKQDDGAFRYDHLGSIPGPGYNVHLYNLVSQVWRSPEEIDRTLWQHQLVVVVPDTVSSDTGMLFVGDNDNDDPLPDAGDPIIQIITQLALGSQTIVSAVYQVPNQPFYFPNDTDRYKEDDLTGYTWDKFLDTGDATWPIHVAMTKSVVKAMDAVQEIAPTLGAYAVDDFVVTGFSKRGQVTWLAAAIDSRIRAIAPGVIDFLNVVPSMENQYRSYGEYGPALHRLVELGIMDRIRTPEFSDLARIIDPYEYRERLTMPKLLLNSAGDEFFMPDSAQFYYKDLPGEKLTRYAPNTGHALENSQTGVLDTLYTLLGWYQAILMDAPRPEIHWQREGGELVATTSIAPQVARVWRASNPDARDFRLNVIGEVWGDENITADADGQYRVPLLQPVSGYAATFIEFVYQGVSGQPVTYSTRVYITPDDLPYELSDPLNDPRLAHYWENQLDIALGSDDGEISRAMFESYLPVPLFDDHVSDTGELDDMLNLDFLSGVSVVDFARRQCMATRLNVRNQQLGWYSDVDTGYLGQAKAWEIYRFAHTAQEYGFNWTAAFACFSLNSL